MAIADHTPAARQAGSAQDGARTGAPAVRYVWALARLSLGFFFVWAFVDKLFGLGHETTAEQAWIHGGHPTMGFLTLGLGRWWGGTRLVERFPVLR